MSHELTTITLDALLNVTGGRHIEGGGVEGAPAVSGAHCQDGMEYGVDGSFKVETPVGLKVEGSGTFVKCK